MLPPESLLQAENLPGVCGSVRGRDSPITENSSDVAADVFALGPIRSGRGGAVIMPLRRVYDLRHTFAAFALRAGISTFDLSRYMGTSLAMIDRHHGHLAHDGSEHAIRLLAAEAPDVHAVGAMDTELRGRRHC
jgi:integrase